MIVYKWKKGVYFGYMRRYLIAAVAALLLLASCSTPLGAEAPPNDGAGGAGFAADAGSGDPSGDGDETDGQDGSGAQGGEAGGSEADGQDGDAGSYGAQGGGTDGDGDWNNGEEAAPLDREAHYIESLIDSMTIEEQVSQMFVLRLRAEHKGPSGALDDFVRKAGAGGYVLFSDNITTVEGTKALSEAVKESSAIAPFVCIDEEGGTVSRLRTAGLPGYVAQPTARRTGATGDPKNAFQAGVAIGAALSSIGVNVNFAPVADVLTNTRNTVIGSRSFGADPALVADMAAEFQAGIKSHGILTAPKHFPGHGNTTEDSHVGSAVSASGLDHLSATEYVPFARLIAQGADFIMAGHIIVTEAEPDGLPATLSKYFLTEVLRGELGFSGVIITDAMDMGAITRGFSPAEAAVLAAQAGADMILMPEDFLSAADGIVKAANAGTIPRDRVRESLTRIFRAKIGAGLIMIE